MRVTPPLRWFVVSVALLLPPDAALACTKPDGSSCDDPTGGVKFENVTLDGNDPLKGRDAADLTAQQRLAAAARNGPNFPGVLPRGEPNVQVNGENPIVATTRLRAPTTNDDASRAKQQVFNAKVVTSGDTSSMLQKPDKSRSPDASSDAMTPLVVKVSAAQLAADPKLQAAADTELVAFWRGTYERMGLPFDEASFRNRLRSQGATPTPEEERAEATRRTRLLASIDAALQRTPEDKQLLAAKRMLEQRVQKMDEKSLKNKIDGIALGTAEDPGASPNPQFASILPMGGGFAASPHAPLNPAAIGGSGLLKDLRGAQAPVQNAANLIRMKDFRAAEAGLIKHLESNPQDQQAWALLSLSRYLDKRYEPSLNAADKALGLNRLDNRTRGVKTRDFLALDRYREAEAEASLALEFAPRDAHSYFNRSEARRALGDDAGALADLKEAAELDDQYADLYAEALSGRPARKNARGAAGLFNKRSALWVGALGTALLFFSFVLYRKRGDTSLRAALRHDDHAAAVAQAPRVDAVPQGFQVVKTLGQGGMGVVYEAVDMALQRTVALKRMRDEVAASPRERARFLKEARVVAGLRHPNIVEIYSVHENDDGLFLVFERVPGVTLHERLGAGALPPAVAVSMLRLVAAALDYAHASGVVHQDLKPANVMVHGDSVKVMDFGIARRVQETLSTMSRVEVAGTPAYMAPEQEQGVGVGPSADLFALGVCAYEALTGRLPFPHGGIMAKIQGTYRPATDGTPLPRAVDEHIARALSPMPDKRHASASAFVEALARALA